MTTRSEKIANEKIANEAARAGEPLPVKGCPDCGSQMVVGAGTYWKCLTCGANSAGKRLRDPLDFTKGTVNEKASR